MDDYAVLNRALRQRDEQEAIRAVFSVKRGLYGRRIIENTAFFKLFLFLMGNVVYDERQDGQNHDCNQEKSERAGG